MKGKNCIRQGRQGEGRVAVDRVQGQVVVVGGRDRKEGGKVTDYPGKVANLVHSYFLPDIFMGRCALRSRDMFVNPLSILLVGTLP